MFSRLKQRGRLQLSAMVRLLRGEVPTARLIKNGLKVGRNFSRQGRCQIDASYPFLIEIGHDVEFATNVTVLAHDDSLKRHIGVCKLGRVSIGDNVFVGANTTILPNVKIGNNVIVGAGSVVTRDIPDGVVCAGNPARVLGAVENHIHKFESRITPQTLLGREYVPACLDADKKTTIKKKCGGGSFCYLKSENYATITQKQK